MIAEDFGPVYTRAQKTREGTANAVCNRHDHWHRGQLLETMSSFDAEKRPGEKCGLGAEQFFQAVLGQSAGIRGLGHAVAEALKLRDVGGG